MDEKLESEIFEEQLNSLYKPTRLDKKRQKAKIRIIKR